MKQEAGALPIAHASVTDGTLNKDALEFGIGADLLGEIIIRQSGQEKR
ncbi:17952_t:CDS:2 [Racocetra fulgida]|uniref:17952_t:CDS:1 n=1 Tax=Racocetra fulgida TaxID=60492 RepID=A0A9N8ZTZ5_9GLOM|nr:17952_t:CDS:2 [Racocetra fulgida]